MGAIILHWEGKLLESVDGSELTSEPSSASNQDWELAFQVLGDQLSSHDGCVSSVALVRELKKKGIDDPRPLVAALQFIDPESRRERGIPTPNFEYGHLGRSFYSKERYDKEQEHQEKATAEEAEDASREASAASPEEITTTRANRQEEARLVTYVKSALEELYASDVGPEDTEFVFDVHSARKGSSFENVDLIAVHWRSQHFCDLIAVEVKLDFTAHAVQQALNYTRFSHRAWVAVVVESDSRAELPRLHPSLFDYAVSNGLGVLACRRRQGRSYEVLPVHWPRRNQPDPLEEQEFVERYREQFEAAEVVEPEQKRVRPRFR
jgi:hypothetical protein